MVYDEMSFVKHEVRQLKTAMANMMEAMNTMEKILNKLIQQQEDKNV